MSTANPDASARKPSGSSTRSGGHSPSSSTNHEDYHMHRKANTGNMLGVGISSANGLKVLSSGWQVWGNPPTRNASTSSAASDPSLSQTESPYRTNMGDTWGSRSTSGTWDEMGDGQKELSQLDAHSLSLHQPRQRHVSASQASALSTQSAAVSRQAQFSPQRYDVGLGRDPPTSNRYVPTSPAKPVAYGVSVSPYSGQQPLLQSNSPGVTYESLQTSSFAEDELSVALRGMAVADDFSLSTQNRAYRQPSTASIPSIVTAQPSLPQVRALPLQPRLPYGGYYPGPSTQIDYQYYDAYHSTPDSSLYALSPALSTATTGPQSFHPHAVTDVHNAQLFYDYSRSSRAMGSQYYYPAQPMVYPPPPSHSPMLSDKKHDIHYAMQPHHQIPAQGVMYPNLRSSPSPHPQGFPPAVDYSMQLQMMLPPGAIYGHGLNPPPMHMYHHDGRGVRRGAVAVDHRVAIRSPLLDDFRANKTRKWELKDIYGYIVEFSGDQHGSRFIQQRLETATIEEKQIIFDEIVPHNALPLIQDVFGNYVVQKLFEHGTQVQKTMLANTMEGHILLLSLQMYGCRVVQKAVEYILPEQQSIFVQELDANVLRCVRDANGNHVIQKLIERVAPERLTFIKAFRSNVYDLATHPYGCRVLQRCFEHLPEENTRPLLDELHKHVNHLMQDQFGNYVVQFVLERGKPQDRALVISKLRGQMLHMARHKFASNVCEKALITADRESRRLLIEEIMTPKQDGLSPVLTMMKDQYANYVLQRALSVVEGDQKVALVNKVRPQLMNMRRYSSAYSKHLIAIERLLEKCGPSAAGDTIPEETAATVVTSDITSTDSPK